MTLIEAALTTVIVGVGVMSMMQLLAAGTVANVDSTNQTTALNLAKNIREATLMMSYDDVVAMDGEVFSPPLDSLRNIVNGMDNWTQTVEVDYIDKDNLDGPPSGSGEAVRVTVTVSKNGDEISRLTWIRTEPL